MPAVVLRPRAMDDLAQIWAYIAEDNARQADVFANLVNSKFQVLARRPGIGRLRPELAAGLRSLAVGRYVIFYIAISPGVEVVRVLHGARDLDALIEEADL